MRSLKHKLLAENVNFSLLVFIDKFYIFNALEMHYLELCTHVVVDAFIIIKYEVRVIFLLSEHVIVIAWLISIYYVI